MKTESKMHVLRWLFLLVLPVLIDVSYTVEVSAGEYTDIIVDRNGNGDYTTITEAINKLPMYQYRRAIILIKNGIYEEHFIIKQNYITLRGESRDSTIIRYNLPREEWNKNKDHIGPGVINIQADDIVLDNLTIENSQPEIGPHAFAIYSTVGTRIIITNCNVISKGGDTVSLWDYKHGMYYHANCHFEGAVDFVCPRGWCFIRNSEFYEVKQTAALWHAGFYNSGQRFVIVNSEFDGVPDFNLGRHHYEAQFYLLFCRFSKNMADRPIYPSLYDDPTKNNPQYYGERKYFYKCEKEGESYGWYKDNLNMAAGSPSAGEITPAWTFEGQWNPEDSTKLKIAEYKIEGKSVTLIFNEIVSIRKKPFFTNKEGKEFRIQMQRFNDIDKLTFVSDSQIKPEDLSGDLTLQGGDIINSIASVYERTLDKKFKIYNSDQ